MTEAEALTTPISMLWESADPDAALTERFGFASAVEATDWLTGVLAEHWGLRVAGCERLVVSDANCLAWITVDGCRMIAKWSMRPRVFARLAVIARLTVWLGERGIPVSIPQAARDGRVQVEVDGFSLGLQRVVDGELLDITDPEQVRAAGEMLARMHAAMADYPELIPTDEPPAPGAQLVGNDFRSANIIWARDPLPPLASDAGGCARGVRRGASCGRAIGQSPTASMPRWTMRGSGVPTTSGSFSS
ncbi:phosphotransferase [Nocardioides sp. NBC_00163]|uniref:phosphotransferase n=1 Tax=Nocardioides sp. NBC_00163 TaxID=2975999 RepID=UPI00324B502E